MTHTPSAPPDEPSKLNLPVDVNRGEPSLTPRFGAALLFVLPLALLTTLMAVTGNFALSVPFGLVCSLVAAVALLALFQSFERHDTVAADVEGRAAGLRCLGELAAAGTLFLAALTLGVRGSLPWPHLLSALLIPGSFMLLVVACFRTAQAVRATERDTPLTRRPGFWLMLFQALVYLPLLGSYSLIDPWETHYGEVAREMLARDDWISLWWAQDGFFWSKPVLDFWLQGLGFSLLGVRYWPDQMLAGVEQGLCPHPEWAVRLPVFLMTALGTYVLYKALSRTLGARAGLLAALVMSSTPYWALLAHQNMTDMPYVAPLVACLSFVMLGFSVTDEPLRQLGLKLGRYTLRFTLSDVFLVLVLICVLPQVCYLVSRQLTFDIDSGVLSVHADRFMSGSGALNCGLPGNAPCRLHAPKNPLWQPALLAALWLFLTLVFVKSSLGLRHTRPLCFLAAWFCLALSVMAKGAPGFVLPVFVVFAFILATKRWRYLLELRPLGCCLLLAILVLPWYAQMLARHGMPFIERLLMHDMYKRAFSHVHDTNDGVDVSFRYYLWQLGYGLFPWAGAALGGLTRWVLLAKVSEPEDQRFGRADVASFAALWFIAGFGLFTVSGTKFHHYILPVVPALAILAGLFLDELMQGAEPPRQRFAYFAGLSFGTSALLAGVVLVLGGSFSGGPPASAGLGFVLGGVVCLLALAMVGAALWFTRSSQAPATSLPYSAGLLGVAAAITTFVVGRDFLSEQGPGLPGQILPMQLFTYQYARTWPEGLDFGAVFGALVVLGSLLYCLLGPPKSRAPAVVALVALASSSSAFLLNLYLPKAAPHWGQRETIAAYYRLRETKQTPLVAFQMNWKGENFYTGNRVAAFVKSGKPFQDWIAAERRRGTKTLYFTTEPSRMKTLKRELGAFQRFEVLTPESLNVRFQIAKVVL